jgi:hypothetical protein
MATSDHHFSPQRIAVPLLIPSRSYRPSRSRHDTSRLSPLLWLSTRLSRTTAIDQTGSDVVGDGIGASTVREGGSGEGVEQ